MVTVESSESDIKDRKKWKKLKYLSLDKLDDYFEGKLDVKKENYAETFSCLLKDATKLLTYMELKIENLK